MNKKEVKTKNVSLLILDIHFWQIYKFENKLESDIIFLPKA